MFRVFDVLTRASGGMVKTLRHMGRHTSLPRGRVERYRPVEGDRVRVAAAVAVNPVRRRQRGSSPYRTKLRQRLPEASYTDAAPTGVLLPWSVVDRPSRGSVEARLFSSGHFRNDSGFKFFKLGRCFCF